MKTEIPVASKAHVVFIHFVEERFAAQLKAQVRYLRFLDTKAGEHQLLGPDVIGATHPLVTLGIVVDFIHSSEGLGQKLSIQEANRLKVAALIHDWGELKLGDFGVGDISFEHKTLEHERVESNVFDQVLTLTPDQNVRYYLRSIYHSIVQNRESKLGRIFNAVERVGYLLTAINCFRGVNGKLIKNWQGLVGNVLSNQIEKLLEYAQDYPHVKNVLLSNLEIVSNMFSSVVEQDVALDYDGNPSFDRIKFIKAYAAWLQSTST